MDLNVEIDKTEENKIPEQKESRKEIPSEYFQLQSTLPFDVFEKCVKKLPDYLKYVLKVESALEMSSDKQLFFLEEFNKRKLWMDLHKFWDKDRREEQKRKRADRIRSKYQLTEFRNYICNELIKLQFSYSVLVKWNPGFPRPLQLQPAQHDKISSFTPIQKESHELNQSLVVSRSESNKSEPPQNSNQVVVKGGENQEKAESEIEVKEISIQEKSNGNESPRKQNDSVPKNPVKDDKEPSNVVTTQRDPGNKNVQKTISGLSRKHYPKIAVVTNSSTSDIKLSERKEDFTIPSFILEETILKVNASNYEPILIDIKNLGFEKPENEMSPQSITEGNGKSTSEDLDSEETKYQLEPTTTSQLVPNVSPHKSKFENEQQKGEENSKIVVRASPQKSKIENTGESEEEKLKPVLHVFNQISVTVNEVESGEEKSESEPSVSPQTSVIDNAREKEEEKLESVSIFSTQISMFTNEGENEEENSEIVPNVSPQTLLTENEGDSNSESPQLSPLQFIEPEENGNAEILDEAFLLSPSTSICKEENEDGESICGSKESSLNVSSSSMENLELCPLIPGFHSSPTQLSDESTFQNNSKCDESIGSESSTESRICDSQLELSVENLELFPLVSGFELYHSELGEGCTLQNTKCDENCSSESLNQSVVGDSPLKSSSANYPNSHLIISPTENKNSDSSPEKVDPVYRKLYNFPADNKQKLLENGIVILVNEQVEIPRQTKAVISVVKLEHFFIVEYDVELDLVMVHDSDPSHTSMPQLRSCLDDFESLLDEKMTEKFRRRQMSDAEEYATMMNFSPTEFCLDFLQSKLNSIQNTNEVETREELKSKSRDQSDNDENNLGFVDSNFDYAEERVKWDVSPPPKFSPNQSASQEKVWLKCCKIWFSPLENPVAECNVCDMTIHNRCSVSNSSGSNETFTCFNCNANKPHKTESPQKSEENDNMRNKNIDSHSISPDFKVDDENKSGSNSDDDPQILTAQEICSVLNVDESALFYTPPVKLNVELSQDHVQKMFSFQKLIEKSGNEIWNVKFQNKQWASTLNSALAHSQIPCSFTATHTPYICDTDLDGKSGESQPHFAHVYGKCNGNCDIKFTVQFPQKPKVGQSSSCIFITKGSFKLKQTQSTARQLTGAERYEIKTIMKNSKANKLFLEKVSHLDFLRLLHQNKSVKSEEVLRTLKSHEKKEKRTNKDEYQDLRNLVKAQKLELYPDTQLPGYIRHLSSDHFQYDLYMWPQIKLMNTLCQKKEVWLTIDASGRITRLPKAEREQKQIFHYIIDVTVDNIQPFTVAEMATTNHRSSNIKAFITRVMDEVKRAGSPLKRLVTGVVTDMSMALIHANCESLNIETFMSYVKRSYKILKGIEVHPDNKSIIFVCINHLLAAYRRNIQKRTLQKEIKKVALSILARIQECCDLRDLEFFSRRAIFILGSEFLDETELESYINDIISKNLDQYETWEGEDDVADFESEVENENENIQESENGTTLEISSQVDAGQPSKEKYSVLKSGNDFYKDFVALRHKFCPELPELFTPKSIEQYLNRTKKTQPTKVKEEGTESSSENKVSVLPRNPYFCPAALELLENYYIPMLPFFSSMVPRACGQESFLRKTNAVVESSFKINKNEWHLQRNMNNADFVREHTNLIRGKIMNIMTDVKQKRKQLEVPLTSLKSAEGEKRGTENDKKSDSKESHTATENWRGQSRKEKPKLRHLSDPTKFNLNKSKHLPIQPVVIQKQPETVTLPPTRVKLNVVKLGVSSYGVVTSDDVATLFNKTWLNDSIMNVFAYLLCDEYDSAPLLSRTLGKLDILESLAITGSKTDLVKNDKAFHRLADGTNTIFCPLNINNSHWVFLKITSIQSSTERVIHIYDSKPNKTSKSKCGKKTTLELSLSLVQDGIDTRFGKSTWNDSTYPFTINQRNNFNCGVSVLYLMFLHSTGNPGKKYTSKYLNEFRMEILKKLLQTTETGQEVLNKSTDEKELQQILKNKQELLKIQEQCTKTNDLDLNSDN